MLEEGIDSKRYKNLSEGQALLFQKSCFVYFFQTMRVCLNSVMVDAVQS